ncbi:hypothetical protein LTR94_029296, partial [Friedmanniomyces endolithicus]
DRFAEGRRGRQHLGRAGTRRADRGGPRHAPAGRHGAAGSRGLLAMPGDRQRRLPQGTVVEDHRGQGDVPPRPRARLFRPGALPPSGPHQPGAAAVQRAGGRGERYRAADAGDRDHAAERRRTGAADQYRAGAGSLADRRAAPVLLRTADAGDALCAGDAARRLLADRLRHQQPAQRRPVGRVHHRDGTRAARLSGWQGAVPARPELVAVGIAADGHRPHVPAPLRHLARGSAAHACRAGADRRRQLSVDRRLGGADAARR